MLTAQLGDKARIKAVKNDKKLYKYLEDKIHFFVSADALSKGIESIPGS